MYVASNQGKKVDFYKIAAIPMLPAVDAYNHIVYLPSYEWWYIDPNDGSIVLDWYKLREWEKSTGYVIVNIPFVHCDENDCYRDWLDCHRFILYPNYTIIELNEREKYVKLRRNSDGVVFKIPHRILGYLLAEITPGMTFCEVMVLFPAIIAKLGLMPRDKLELLERDPAQLVAMYTDLLIHVMTNLFVAPGLILVQVK